MTTRRTGLVAGLVLVVVSTALASVLLREDDGTTVCAVAAVAAQPDPQLLPRDELLPAGTVGEERQVTVDAVEGIGGPVGDVVGGRFFDADGEQPIPLAYADRLALVAPGADADTGDEQSSASLDVVDLDSDRLDTAWRAELTGTPPWTTFTGGAVGDLLSLAFSGARPTLLTLYDDGGVATCADVPGAATSQVRTDQAGSDVVLATQDPDASAATVVTVSRVDPATGRVRWERELLPGRPVAAVEVVGEQVLLAGADAQTVGTDGLPRRGVGQPWLTALDLADGTDAWALDGRGARERDAVVMLDTDADGAIVLRVGTGPRQVRLVALDGEGEQRWARRVRPGTTYAELWGDRVVTRAADPAGGQVLRAYDAADGAPAWVVRSRQTPPVGEDPRPGFGAPLVEDGTAWVPAPNGVAEVDLASGRLTRRDSTARVDALLRVGDHLVVASGAALLVTLAS